MTRNLPLTLPANSYLLGVWSSREDNVTCLPPTWSYIAEFFIYSATFENLNPSVVKTAPSFSVVLISSGFLMNPYKYTIIMKLICQTESPNLKLQNSPAISPIQNSKSSSFEVL